MYFEGEYSITIAKEQNLIPLTTWVFKEHYGWLISERNRIGDNPNRRVMIVTCNNRRALFGNDVTGRYNSYDENMDIDLR